MEALPFQGEGNGNGVRLGLIYDENNLILPMFPLKKISGITHQDFHVQEGAGREGARFLRCGSQGWAVAGVAGPL